MLISHRHKFIYYAPVKTATSSLEAVLMNQYEAETLGLGNKWVKDRHSVFVPPNCDDYFVFVSVRNPFARHLSSYNFFASPGESIESWEARNFVRPICDELFTKSPPVRLDAIVRVETLDRDFGRLPFVKSPTRMPTYNETKKKRLTELSEASEEYVRRRYKDDFMIFGYRPDVPAGKPLKLL